MPAAPVGGHPRPRHRRPPPPGPGLWQRGVGTDVRHVPHTIEGTNGYLKDTAHESLASPGRGRVRGIAAQSIFVALLLMAGNFRKISSFRQMVADGSAAKVAARALRRRGQPG